MSDIDSLDIKIAASADKAVQSINTLIKKLNEVKSALNMGDVANIVSNSMKNVGSSVENSMQKAEQTVEKTTKKIARTFDDISKKYGHIGVGFDIAGASKETYQKYLNNFMNQQANALEKIQELEIGGKTGSQAYETAVKNYTILGNKIDSIVEKMRKMDMPLQTDEEIASLAKKAYEAAHAIHEATEETIRYGRALENGAYAGRDIEQEVLQIEENAQRAKIQIGAISDGIDLASQRSMTLAEIFKKLKVTSAADGMDKVQSAIERTKEAFKKLAENIDIANRHSKDYTKTAAYERQMRDVEGLRNKYAQLIMMQKQLAVAAEQERVSSAMQRAQAETEKANEKMKTYAKSVRKTTSDVDVLDKALGKIAKRITRIGNMFKLMLTRMALRKIIENIGTGFKGLALYSSEFDNNLSMVINSLKQFGYSIAAAIGPLFNALAPVFNKIIQLCIKVVNYINQLISALQGKKTWIRAKEQVGSYAKSLKEAGKAAKGSLRDIDELNNLTRDSGSGSGASGINPDDMYETVEIESNILKLADTILKIWEKVKDVLWNVFDVLVKIGKWVYDAVTSTLTAAYVTAQKIWEKIGPFITGAWIITKEALNNIKNAVTTTFAAAKITTETIMPIIKGHIETNLLASQMFATNALAKIKTAFNDNFAAIKITTEKVWPDIKNAITTNLTAANATITTLVAKIKTNITTAWATLKTITTTTWLAITSGISTNITKASTTVLNVLKNIKDAFVNTFNAIKEKIKPIWDGIVYVIKAPIVTIVAYINKMISGIMQGINGAIDLLNVLKFDVPEWVPEIGGKKFGLNIPKLTVPLIPSFAKGGLVPNVGSYSLFAAGENGIPEILGTVGGRTAVAGGAEITGIRDAIYETASEEVVLLRQQNQLLQGILQKEFGISKSDIGKAARNYGKEYYDRTGDNAFVF